jgi:hypothetical protein
LSTVRCPGIPFFTRTPRRPILNHLTSGGFPGIMQTEHEADYSSPFAMSYCGVLSRGSQANSGYMDKLKLLKSNVVEIIFNNSARTAKKSQHVSITYIIWVMLFR